MKASEAMWLVNPNRMQEEAAMGCFAVLSMTRAGAVRGNRMQHDQGSGLLNRKSVGNSALFLCLKKNKEGNGMAELFIGGAIVLLMAATGLTGYGLGLKSKAKIPHGVDAGAGAQQQDALMKKYEAILDYDPYGTQV